MTVSKYAEGKTAGEMPVDPLIGMLIDDRYRIIRLLARGGMATVHIAHDERLDRPVALKVMHPHLADNASFVSRFRREARAAARIIHPGVVSVFDQGVVAGQGFLVMELVNGPTIRSLLSSQGSFTLGRALEITKEVLEALRAAHREGVIHRDIKPENILVPSDPPVRVTDFGLARAISEVSMSTTGSMLGTVGYVAPEVLTSGHTDPRTDLYSVGIMLHEMLTGHIPWADENTLSIAYHHVNDDVPAPSSEIAWLPREIDDLLGALCARVPQERPADADESLDLLARTHEALPSELLARRADVEPTCPSPPDDTEKEAEESPDSNATATISFIPLTPTRPLPSTREESSPDSADVSSTVGKRTQRPRWRQTVQFLSLILLLVATCAGSWWLWNEHGPGAYRALPHLEGVALSAASEKAADLGFAVTVVEEFSDTVAAGTVISSDPAGGASVHKDSNIRLLVSKGVDMKVVPSVVGATKDEAIATLVRVGLSAGKISEQWSEDVPAGKILSQGASADSSLPHDTAVDLVVSKGREPIQVPDVVGLSQPEATAALTAVRLKAQTSEAFSDTVEVGYVISQGAEAGSSLHIGDSVAFVVSKGPEMVVVPEVFGLQEADAVSALEAAGLKVNVERVLGGVFGTVRSVEPGASTSVRKGSTVTITIV